MTSLYTNITQDEWINIICNAYDSHHKDKLPIPTQSLERALRLILEENSFQFNRNKLSSDTGQRWEQR